MGDLRPSNCNATRRGGARTPGTCAWSGIDRTDLTLNGRAVDAQSPIGNPRASCGIAWITWIAAAAQPNCSAERVLALSPAGRVHPNHAAQANREQQRA